MIDISNPQDALRLAQQDEATAKEVVHTVRAKIHAGGGTSLGADWVQAFVDGAVEVLRKSADPVTAGMVADAAIYSNSGLYPGENCRENAIRLRDAAVDAEQRLGQRNQFAFVRGLACYILGDHDSAQEQFARIAPADDDKLLFHHTGAPSFRATLETTAHPVEIDWHKEAQVGEILYLVACDSGYFGAYAKDFVARTLAVEPDAAFHFHIVNPISSIIDAVDFGGTSVGMSFETIGAGNIKTYTTCARFNVATRMMERYKSAIIISDIDMDISVTPKRIIEQCGNDIGFYVGPLLGYFPWMAIIANHNYFPCTETSRQFLSLAGDFMLTQFHAGNDGWMLDQVGLEYAFRKLAPAHRDLTKIDYPLKQFSDRPQRRGIARKLLENAK